MALTNLSGIFADIGNLAGGLTGQTVLDSLATGALGTIVVAGAQSKQGQDTLDPLHWFHHPADPASGAGQVTGVISGGNVMTMSAYQALSPENQKMVAAMKYTIIPG